MLVPKLDRKPLYSKEHILDLPLKAHSTTHCTVQEPRNYLPE